MPTFPDDPPRVFSEAAEHVTDQVDAAEVAVDKPIEVKPTVLVDQVFAFLRVMGVLIGGVTALLGFLEKRDLVGLVEFARSSDLIPAIGSAVGLGALIYGNLNTRWRKQELIVSAASADDSVARVVGAVRSR